MTQRPVTEADFRMPEYRDAVVSDYEWRADGALVRKDRWETGIHSIRDILEISSRNFEISAVVEAVRRLVDDQHNWNGLHEEFLELPVPGELVDVRLGDGTVLRGATFSASHAPRWAWRNVDYSSDVIAWRDHVPLDA